MCENITYNSSVILSIYKNNLIHLTCYLRKNIIKYFVYIYNSVILDDRHNTCT